MILALPSHLLTLRPRCILASAPSSSLDLLDFQPLDRSEIPLYSMLATSAGLEPEEKQRKSKGPGSSVAMMGSLYVRQLIQRQLTKLG